MALQSVLANPNILCEIFLNLSIDPDRRENLDSFLLDETGGLETKRRRRALASAALTCKAFSEPANGVLYEVLSRLSAALHTFPGLSRGGSNPSSGMISMGPWAKKQYIINGEIPASQWARFEHVARRVRYLTYDSEDIDASLLRLLASRYDVNPILPNLRRLIWLGSPGDAASHLILRCLCTIPTLSTVEVDLSPHLQQVERDIPVIPQARPDLLHFRADSLQSSAHQQVLTAFTHLRSIRLRKIGDVLLRHLATLNHLEELDTTFESSRRSSNNPTPDTANEPLPEGSFPVIRRLRISASSGHAVVLRVLSAISSTSLTSLTVKFSEKLSANGLRFVESLSSLPALLSVRRLHIHVDFAARADSGHEDGVVMAFSDYLRPLLHLLSLEDIMLDVRYRAWSISDDDIDTVKNTWPQLVHLSVRDYESESYQRSFQRSGAVRIVRPSLKALVGFAQSCRRLETLDFEVARISERQLVWLETSVAQTAPQMALQSIAFARARYCEQIVLPDVDRLARALHALFPRLGNGSEYRMEFEEENYEEWSPGLPIFRLLKTLEKLKQ